MTITTRNLSQASGLAAIIAGAIFVGVQINHPPLTIATVDGTEWFIRSAAKSLMAALALAGITGMYLHQRAKVGILGLAGYLFFSVGYLAMFSVEVFAGFGLPALTKSSPKFVDDMLLAATGGNAAGDIGHFQVIFNLVGAGYILGGLLFGIALYRAAVLARWASVLLAVSTSATAALAVLPDAFNRPLAVPEGIALIGLGWSLWKSNQRAQAPDLAPMTAPAAVG